MIPAIKPSFAKSSYVNSSKSYLSSRRFASNNLGFFGKNQSKYERSSQNNNKGAFNTKSSTFGVGSGILISVAAAGAAILYYSNQEVIYAEQQEDNSNQKVSNETQPQAETDKPSIRTISKYKYVIVGTGTAGFSAVQEIVKNDPEGKILVVGTEKDLPYQRPPLSKELWSSEDPEVAKNLKFKNWEGKESSVYYETSQFFEEHADQITVKLGHEVVDLDPTEKALLMNNNEIVYYDKCLIATGGTPRQLPGVTGEIASQVSTYRTLEDFRKLDQLARTSGHIVVIGGGFLGSELACGLAKRGKSTGVKITQVFPETGLMGNVFPRYLSDYTTERVRRELGYEMLPNRLVSSVSAQNGKIELTLDNNEKLSADHVVVAVGIKPNNDLAKKADLEIDEKNGGIIVNAELQARSDLYVAGDVASYHDVYLGRRRIEHYDHAMSSGKHVGKAMSSNSGSRAIYKHMPFFWSDVSTIGYEAVGVLDARLKTVSVWQKPENEQEAASKEGTEYKRGIVYYLNDKDAVVGVLLWGVFGKVDDARSIIKSAKPVSDVNNLKHFISLEEEPHH